MGVPKFFRYTSERYPCLNELVKQYQIPDFDNMYLDMNGIIHNCSHPDDSNAHFRITEEKIFQDIFHYLSILFQIIKPKKLFFMAIDGVAPRAKMNQQRGRRFRSAREAEKIEEEARSKGETLPSEKRFDSNCITPGTVFMARLHEQLRFFVKEKMSTDPLWAKVKVVLSGHETPGEGEHKIMDYIRWARSQPDYDPNTRHCLYGLDADLIMLGMCTHEPHFALLREEVKFGRTAQRSTSPEETNFYLLHLSLLREYLEQEFISIKDKLSFPFDIEKVVDDWVLMGFLVGNDFIPNLPNMHISNDAMPILYKTYMEVLPTLSGYINESGELNLERFEIFMQEIAKLDKEKFQDTYADLKYFEAKTGRRPNAQERKEYKPNDNDTFNVDVNEIKAGPDADLQALINATDDMFLDDDADDEDYEETSDEEANIEMEFKLHKRDYYMTKLDYSSVTDEVLASQAEGYVRAIQWNLYYYYKGCPSWCWYYPHHYAPYMSDIKGFKDLKIEFELGDPFKPFEQLLAVLPAASKNLLPAPFHDLMTDEDSPIVHYYPVNFETDLNGKINDWEAVVLIPFINEVNLLSAMSPCYKRLTEEELMRNTHGPMLVYNWSPQSLGTVCAPEYFQPISECHAMERRVFRQELEVLPQDLKKGMLPNARRDMLFPGFPTMRHLKYRTSLKNARVRVFDQPSRNQNMIVEIIREENEEKELTRIAEELLGKVIWAGWPHLTRAKVISVSNEKLRLHYVDKQNNNINGAPTYTTEPNEGNLHKQWISERSTIIEHHNNRLGINLGNVNIIVHAVNHKGYKYVIQDNVQMVEEPEWCTVPCGYAFHAIVKDVTAYIMQEAGRFSTPQEAYPPGDHVFLLTQGQYYGCQATVVDSEAIRSGRIKVQVMERPEPVPAIHAAASPYHNANHAAAACGISTQMLSRITGCVFVVAGERNDLPTEQVSKVNIGLNLKFNKKNLEVSGYTRRCKVTNAWLYSWRCVELVKSYARQFPNVFDNLVHNIHNDIFFESDIWRDELGQKKQVEVQTWLKAQPHYKAARRECGSEALEPEEMKALAQDLDSQLTKLKDKEKKVTLQVKWNLLYKPELHSGNIQPDPKADYKMYDRVVCVSRTITVPFGATGTVTAVFPAPNANTVRLSDKLNAEATYQVLFDEPFPGAMAEDLFEQLRFYRMQPTHMLNISYGRKLRDLVTTVRHDNRDEYGFTYPTNILRKEDGHNSAFASYSPPVDKKLSPTEPSHHASTTPSHALPTPDNATHLLKSLLKISENDNDKKSKNQQNQNWRVKNDDSPKAPPQPQNQIRLPHQQSQNWRKESVQNNVRHQPPAPAAVPNEWTNSNYKNQPAVPSFGQHGPVANQMPFPQFPTPQFHRNNNMAYRHETRNQPHFPQHLPNTSVTLGPSWMSGQNQSTPSAPAPSLSRQNSTGQSSADKLSNPFVPLQVQTSQRRIQKSGSSSSRKETGDLAAPKCILPQTQPNNMQASQQPQSQAPKPIKKKRPRIAANLPFQMD